MSNEDLSLGAQGERAVHVHGDALQHRDPVQLGCLKQRGIEAAQRNSHDLI